MTVNMDVEEALLCLEEYSMICFSSVQLERVKLELLTLLLNYYVTAAAHYSYISGSHT